MQKKYDEYQDTVPFATNECSEGLCSVNTTLSSLQEVITVYLKKLAFYLNRLNKYGIRKDSAKYIVMYALFNVMTNADYRQNDFCLILKKLNDTISQAKHIYEEKCIEEGISPERLKTYLKTNENISIPDAIKKGEKYSLKKLQAYTSEQKDFLDIIMILLKSITIRLIETYRLGKECSEYFYGVISLLDALNFLNYSEKTAKLAIHNGIETYYDITKLLHATKREIYGEIKPTEVSLSTRPGKAILVSGYDFKKLEDILEATKNKDIDIYTHGSEMLMSHAFKNFSKYPNFRGHYGFGIGASLIDFATFPGAIIMTKSTIQKMEILYRGRLFTLDPIPPMGVVGLKDDDLSLLIKSAQSAKGFSKGQIRPSIKVGYDEKILRDKVKEVCDKVKSGKIKHIFIVGLINFPNYDKEYFKELIENIPDDCFAFSLCYPVQAGNIFHIKSFYDYSLAEMLLASFEANLPLGEMPLTVFVANCDSYTISNLLYLKYKKIKNIFMSNCSPYLINPSIINRFRTTYDIKEITTPNEDLKISLGKDFKPQKE